MFGSVTLCLSLPASIAMRGQSQTNVSVNLIQQVGFWLCLYAYSLMGSRALLLSHRTPRTSHLISMSVFTLIQYSHPNLLLLCSVRFTTFRSQQTGIALGHSIN